LGIECLDELLTGMPVAALPLIRDGLRLSYAQVGLLFTIAALAGMLLEPAILLFSDRGSKRWLVLAGLLGLAASDALLGSAPNFLWLALAFVLGAPSGGAAVGLAQAALIDQRPHDAARSMTRWTIAGSVGDVLSPLATAGLLALGLGWRSLFWLSALAWLGAALLLWPNPFPRPAPEDAAEQVMQARKPAAPVSGVLAGFREALRDPLLLRWAVVVKLCSMVDEVFLGFAALYLRDVHHASATVTSLALAAGMVGSVLGLLALHRLLKRISGPRLLPWLALLTLVGVIALLLAPTIWLAAAALFLLDFSAAGWYPISKAAAYARLPGRTGTVQAVITLGEPFEVALPLVVGLVAGQFGVLAGLAFLGLAPLGVLLVAPKGRKAGQFA
jgi:predicted MFS family arabinose efflux permease